MREIKFRAWDKKSKKMRAINSIAFHGLGSFDIPTQDIKLINLWGYNIIEEKHIIAQREPGQVELLQFTGLKDKNGTEIYEGDIVSRYYEVGKELYDPDSLAVVDYAVEKEGLYIGVVNYRPSAGFILNSCRHYDNGGNHLGNLSGIKIYPQFSKVIGNIYENPELLEVD